MREGPGRAARRRSRERGRLRKEREERSIQEQAIEEPRERVTNEPRERVQEPFQEHRNLLFAVAYRMLGSVADAEDVVQDAWLRWSSADRSDVNDPKAYLIRIATNIALDRLRSARARRESYVGPWLPEPVLTSPDVADGVELAESVSMAMLVVLETLSPLERAVFVLREVFGFAHAEVAAALGRSEASVRQLAHRAREHVEARRPRFQADRDASRRVTEAFLDATVSGDVDALLAVLAPDVTLWSDGGGKARAPRTPVTGARHVARLMAVFASRPYGGVPVEEMTVHRATINGAPGLLVYGAGRPLTALIVTVAEGLVRDIHLVANPDKLRSLAGGRSLPL